MQFDVSRSLFPEEFVTLEGIEYYGQLSEAEMDALEEALRWLKITGHR